MRESLEEAERELKRVDHLIYVSLKYTRTVDVHLSTVQRIIDSYDSAIRSMLKYLEEQGRISSIPKSPGLRARILREQFAEEPVFQDFLVHYGLMREILRAEFDRREEFRRHVTMISKLKSSLVEVTIDSITLDYKKVRAFVRLAEEFMRNEGKGDVAEMLRRVEVELEFDKRYY